MNDPEFYAAIKRGDINTVFHYISNGKVNINECSEQGIPPILYAVKSNQPVLVDYLVRSGADVDAYDTTFSYNPLIYATKYGSALMVELLLQLNANVESRNINNSPAILSIYEDERLDILNLLLSKGAFVDVKNSSQGISPLMRATGYGAEKIVDRLLEAHADLELKDHGGNTALNHAVINNRINIVRTLLKHGAQANTLNIDFTTPLFVAAANGFIEIGELLIEYGVSVDAIDLAGITPLMIAVTENQATFVNMLLYYGVNPFKTDQNGQSPIRLTQINQKRLNKSLLTNYLANINCINSAGYSPLAISTLTGNYEFTKQLLNHGADVGFVRQQTGDGILPLAVEGGSLQVVDLIVSTSHCARMPHPQHYRTLQKAIYLNRNEIFAYLVNRIMLDSNTYEFKQLMRLTVEQGRADMFFNLYLMISNTKLRGDYLFNAVLTSVSNGNTDFCRQVFYNIRDELAWVDSPFNNMLHTAATFGHSQLIQLLSQYLNVNLLNRVGVSALALAAQEGQINVIQTLAALNANLDEPSGLQEKTPLMTAVYNGKIEAAKTLIDLGANIFKKDSYGNTAMHILASLNFYKYNDPTILIQAFQSKGFDFNAVNHSNETPMMLAAEQENEVLVALLTSCTNPRILEPHTSGNLMFFKQITAETNIIENIEEDWFYSYEK